MHYSFHINGTDYMCMVVLYCVRVVIELYTALSGESRVQPVCNLNAVVCRVNIHRMYVLKYTNGSNE